MKQNLFKNVWLRICMIVAVVTTAFASTAWAEDVTASLSRITEASGNLHKFLTYTKTGTVTFTVSLTDEAYNYGSRITSVSFAGSVSSEWKYKVDNGSEQTISSTTNISLSNIEGKTVVFRTTYNKTLDITSVNVTYTAPVFPYTVVAAANEEGWGTVSVVGNVITAKPTMGYVFADPAYTVEGATVTQDGNDFVVTDATEGSTVNVTINFDRSSVAPSFDVDFESDLTAYEWWVFTGITRSNMNYHDGGYCGQATSTATITTATKIDNPGTLTFYARGSQDGAVTWSVYVSTDGSNWGSAVSSKSIANATYEEFKVDLSSYTKVYIRIAASGASFGAIDDIDLTTLASIFKVSVADCGYSTFCSPRDLDFSDVNDIEVFFITTEDGSTLKYNQITKVPANTGVLLHKEGGATDVEVPVINGGTDATTGNLLVPGSDETTVTWTATDRNYILYNHPTKGVGFFGANSSPVASNRAYLHLDGNAPTVKSFVINLEDDATGIEAIENAVEDGAIYNVAGQRLQKMQKGINIVNGKKVLF